MPLETFEPDARLNIRHFSNEAPKNHAEKVFQIETFLTAEEREVMYKELAHYLQGERKDTEWRPLPDTILSLNILFPGRAIEPPLSDGERFVLKEKLKEVAYSPDNGLVYAACYRNLFPEDAFPLDSRFVGSEYQAAQARDLMNPKINLQSVQYLLREVAGCRVLYPDRSSPIQQMSKEDQTKLAEDLFSKVFVLHSEQKWDWDFINALRDLEIVFARGVEVTPEGVKLINEASDEPLDQPHPLPQTRNF